MPGVARDCQEMPEGVRSCQDLSGLPGVANSCQSVLLVARSCPGVVRCCKDVSQSLSMNVENYLSNVFLSLLAKVCSRSY